VRLSAKRGRTFWQRPRISTSSRTAASACSQLDHYELNEALHAQEILAEKYGVQADVWSLTSYNQLRREALATERWNRLHPSEPEKRPYVLTALEGTEGPIIAATDYMKIVPDQLAPWLGGRLLSLGTDGFDRSDNREFLRRHFEVDASSLAAAAQARRRRKRKAPKPGLVFVRLS